MTLPRLLVLLLATSVLAQPPGPLAAQEARVVPVWDPVYDDVDRLLDAGLLPGLPAGQRPWSIRLLRRAAVEAREALASGAEEEERRRWLQEVLARVERRVAGDGGRLAAADALVEVVGADAAVRGTPDNGQGTLADAVFPLLAYRSGRGVPDGALVVAEPSLVWAPADRLAVEFRPRLRAGSDAGGGADELGVATLQARVLLGPIALVLGRGDVVWGAAEERSLMLSGNARALDRLEVSTDLPRRLGVLGPGRFTVFLADLGENRLRPHSKLLGATLSVRPHERLELGWTYLNQQSGEGAPEARFWERVADVLIIPDLFRAGEDFEFSEKFMGAEARWRVPSSVGLHLFLEGALTDFDVGRVVSLVRDDASWRGGLELARLGDRGAGWLRLTGTRTGLRWYRHTQFPSGLTLDGAVLGSALGPHGRAVAVHGGWEDGTGRLWTGGVAWESRSADVHAFQPDGDPPFPKVRDRPEERRLRALLGLALPLRPVRLEIDAGVERVGSFAFESGDDRTFAFVSVRGLWYKHL